MSGGKLDRFCAFRGLGAVPIQLVTNSGGGLLHDSVVICYKPHFAISLPGSHLAVVDRPASDDTAGTSRTIATPHFLPLYRHAGVGVCYRVCYKPCTPPFGGRYRPIYPCGKASVTDPKRALTRRRKTP